MCICLYVQVHICVEVHKNVKTIQVGLQVCSSSTVHLLEAPGSQQAGVYQVGEAGLPGGTRDLPVSVFPGWDSKCVPPCPAFCMNGGH